MTLTTYQGVLIRKMVISVIFRSEVKENLYFEMITSVMIKSITFSPTTGHLTSVHGIFSL